MASNRFEYGGSQRTVESVVRRGQQAGRGYDSYIQRDFPTWKVKEGENCCRIMQNTWSKKDKELWGDMWDIRVYIHYNVGPDNATYLCLDKMKGEPCPVCDARRDTDNPDEQDELRFSERRLAWAVDRNNEKAGPQVWQLPPTLYGEIVKRSVDKKTNRLIPIDSPNDDGFDVIFHRDGTDKRTKYTGVDVDRDTSPLHKNEDRAADWIDYTKANPLPSVLQYYDYEYIEKVLFGRKRAERDEDEERGSRRPSRRDDDDRRSPRRREEEEERPSRAARPRRDEEYDEPRPRRKPEPVEEEEEDRRPQRARDRDEDREDSPWKEKEEDEGGRGREEEADERPRKAGRFRPQEEEEDRPRGGRHTARGSNGGDEEEPEKSSSDEEKAPPRGKSGGRFTGLQERRGR